MNTENRETDSRRKFLKKLSSGGILAASGMAIGSICSCKQPSNEKTTVLTTDGKLVQVPNSEMESMGHQHISPNESREGIPGKKFVMVVDLGKCKNAKKCIEVCDETHNLTPDRPYIKVLEMKDNEKSSPYWMPKKCFQCDNPPCVKVCPVGATYKRTDGIVLIDNERCIGCRFCMAACPYSARVFNWGTPPDQDDPTPYSPETSIPSSVGTVGKCDFCPDMLRQNMLPHCVTSCPNGVIYFGDEIDDTVTNGEETVRLSTLLKDKAGYRYMEELGTKPRVYYLPPVDRLFPFEKDSEENGES
ncbi:MAG: 4Fe-4S dicluster domain-containing protein [Flavobacteriaceae bacterium]|nr:4Fe-4S dicluster domain-containing protein [Bacteroidia bacterium]MBT8287398.1 4Fe-4S dicluster domain-containing protein [Bacteroidia bacterium]NNF74033.1 4Fe-4S dicluster domain-containing protein [Flavobacteriaceae bacterium]NNK74121.1 4Fe-4S dicluster domain-containing protein [Flavobacteriaceae bacterium]